MEDRPQGGHRLLACGELHHLCHCFGCFCVCSNFFYALSTSDRSHPCFFTLHSLRVMDIYETKDPDLALHYRRQSFYVLAMAAPLIWMKLLTVFDVYPFFGTMQIVGACAKEERVD